MRTLLLENNSLPQGPSYTFPRKDKAAQWPTKDGTALGMAGIWNLLFRSGARLVVVQEANFPKSEAGDVLYVSADTRFSDQGEKMLQQWLAAGGRIVATGNVEAWRFVFPEEVLSEKAEYDHPYAALSWLFGDAEPQLIAPPKWSYARIRARSNGKVACYGRIAVVHGERQTPGRALITALEDAPAIVQIGNVWYLNGNPFAALQAWMQGQEDLEPWIGWRHRLFWLDEFGAFLCKTLRAHRLLPPLQKGIPGLEQTTLVLKHDLDFSRDTAYLDLENQAGVAGVYPVLRDSNTAFWVAKLGSQLAHESAFHYNTARYLRVIEAARHMLLNVPKRPMRPDRKGIQGTGLLKQVQWAKQHGIGIETLHRHAIFLLYPELVDALDTVYNGLPEVLGSNSFFRSQVLRWGIDVPDGMRGTLGSFPDPQFPCWFPFRLAHAGDRGRMLRGWESTCMMELEPALVEQMLDHAVPDLPQRVIVLNYHPAHAGSATFARDGCADWVREVLAICRQRCIEVTTLAEVYRRLNDFVGDAAAPQ